MEKNLTDHRKRSSAARVAILAVCAALCALPSAGAQSASSLDDFFASVFPDNADVRAKLFSSIIGAPKDLALAYGEKAHQSRSGPVSVRAVKRQDDFIIEFINGAGDRPTMGSVYIQRSNAKGYMVQAKILLEDDPSCYLRLYPQSQGSGTRGDVVMYGAVVKKGLYFDGMLYRIIILPFADIVDMTKKAFDWGGIYGIGSQERAEDLIADFRQGGAAAPAAPAPAAPATQGAGVKTALASAPPVPVAGVPQPAAVAKAATRAGRIAAVLERASAAESLALELAQAGEAGAREISLQGDAAAAYGDDKGDPGFSSYGAFPRYDAAKGIPLAAARAALYLDLSSNPDSAYALVGDGLRAVALPSFDAEGRFSFAFFADGKETAWDDLQSGKRDLKVRIVRLPASRD
jgi:hypothetical protein